MRFRFSSSQKIFFILFFIFFITASGNIDSIDGVTHYFLSKKIFIEKKIYFEKSEQKVLGMPVMLNIKDNKYYPLYNPGYAVIVSPIILLDNSIRSMLNIEKPYWSVQNNYVIIFLANLFNAVIIGLVAVQIFLISKKYITNKKILTFLPAIVITEILATNLVIQAHQHFAHPLFLFFMLNSFIYLDYWGKTKDVKKLIILSLNFLAMASVYNATFVFMIPPFALYVIYLYRIKLWQIIQLGIAFLPAILMQMSWNFFRFGGLLSTGYLERKESIYVFDIYHFFKNFYGMTFGPNKGVFLFNPILFLAPFVALYILKRKEVDKHKSLTLMFVVISLILLLNYSLVTFWHGDSAFGPRYLLPLIIFGIIVINAALQNFYHTFWKYIFIILITVGVFVQIPGMLIPNFSFIFLGPAYCQEYEHNYFNWRCSPLKVGWSHLLKRRIKETITTVGIPGKVNTISSTYPNPAKQFRTVYPDPLFDKFSSYKVKNFPLNQNLMNDIYSFTLDIWWLKGILYKNVFNL